MSSLQGIGAPSDPRHWSRLHRRGRRRVIGAVLVLVPWSWFLVRDTWAPLNAASVALPAAAALAGVLLVGAALILRRWLPALAALSLVAMTALTVMGPRLPQPVQPIAHPITIASANIYESNRTPQQAAAALAGTHADLLVAVETPSGFAERLGAEAEASHPYQVSTSGMAVNSVYPITLLPQPMKASPDRVLMATVRPEGAPAFTLLALHAINPTQESSFSFQEAFIERLDKAARERQTSDGPIVIAGDLNLSDRTHGYRILSSDFRDAMRAGAWPGDTYQQGVWQLALLRIDHIFISKSWCAADPSRFTVTGSDHEGIRATIGPCG